MLKYLTPQQYVEDIFAINIQELANSGIRVILTDLDNTLVPWNSDQFTGELQAWIGELKEKSFKICVVSNNSAKRGKDLIEALDISAVWRAGKPGKRAYLKALDTMGFKPSEAVMIGDQVFTDILGANRLGLYTILVKPINNREFLFTKLKRPVEIFVLSILKRRGALK